MSRYCVKPHSFGTYREKEVRRREGRSREGEEEAWGRTEEGNDNGEIGRKVGREE